MCKQQDVVMTDTISDVGSLLEGPEHRLVERRNSGGEKRRFCFKMTGF